MRTHTLVLSAIVLLFMMGLVVSGAQGAPSAPTGVYSLQPTADVYIRSDLPERTSNTGRLAIRASVTPDDPPLCSPSMISYLLFDLGGIPAGEIVTDATLTLIVESSVQALTMAIRASDTTDWLESGTDGDPKLPTWNSQLPLGDTVFATATSAPSGSISFNDPALTSYLKGKKGGKVTLAIVPQLPCGPNPLPQQYFRSKEFGEPPGIAAPQLALTTSLSNIAGSIQVQCKNLFTQAGAGTVDMSVTSTDGSYNASFSDVGLTGGAFSIQIPSDKCTASGICSLTLTDVSGLTNPVPGDLCPANGDTFAYPVGNGWTYMNQPAKPFQNAEVLAAAAASPLDASVGSFSVVPGVTANAVTLRTFRSSDPAVNWPLIAGGAALLALVGGYGVYRWRLSRAATHSN